MPKYEIPPDAFVLKLYDGKYTYVREKNGKQYALRYDEKWRDLIGDNFVAVLVNALEEEQERSKELHALLAECEPYIIYVEKHDPTSTSKQQEEAADLYQRITKAHDKVVANGN